MGQSSTKGGGHRLLFLCFFMPFYLTTYTATYAEQGASIKQNDWDEQGNKKVTLVVNNQPIRAIFKSIESQTGMKFFFSEEHIDQEAKFSLSMINKSVDEVLRKLLKGYGVIWRYSENVIVIKKSSSANSTPSVKSSIDSTINSITLTGKITDAAGNPIPGATIRVKRTNDGATTDEDGNFTLPNTRPSENLIISSIGYETREITVDGKSLMVKLNVVVNDLDETVIKGYYNTTKRLNTGNISSVKAEDIAKQPVGDPLATLQGRVPGLFIQQQSGAPGTQFTIQLRGRNSLRSDANNPLLIVDGVPLPTTTLNSDLAYGVGAMSPLNAINTADIESIEILKDADATAIYGSRGANGVMLITTKKGKAQKAKVNINIYTGLGRITLKEKLLTRRQYLDMRYEAYKNDMASIIPNNWDSYDLTVWDTTRSTDWQKIFIGGTSHVTDIQSSLSGGTSQTQFTFGGGYRRETTVFPGNFFDKKVSAHIGLNHHSPNQKFKASFTASFLNNNNQMPSEDLTRYILLAPNAPELHNQQGELNWENNTWENPFALLKRRSKAITDNLFGNLTISYDLLKDLHLKSSFGYNKMTLKQNRLFPLSSYSPQYSSLSAFRQNQLGNTTTETWIIEPQLSYELTIGDGHFDVMAGATLQENRQEAIAQIARDFSNDALIENIQAATTLLTISNRNVQYRYSAIYGRLGYSYKEKYILNFTARRDGSSRFGSGRQFGNFGAIGAAWIFSNENFLRNLQPVLSFGKLRASYGSTGNDKIGDYQYLSTYSTSNYSYQGLNGLYPTRLANPEFGWEKVTKLEAGLEIGLVKDKILLTTSWYKNRTNNQLVGYPLPSTAGFNSIQYNLPAVIENTGLEFDVNTINIKTKRFHWNTNINITIPKNKLVSFPNIEGSAYNTTYAVGQSLYVSYLYHYTGVDPKSGIYTFEDINKDGSYTYEDDRKFVFTGPQYFGGMQNELSFKQWQLSFLLQFVKQKGRVATSSGLPGTFQSGNQPIEVLNRWREGDNKGTTYQKYSQNWGSDVASAQILFMDSDALIRDASFIRLKNLSLSYNASSRWTERIHLRDFRIFIQCQNLFTITGYDGIGDPENGGGFNLPPIRMISAGFNLGF